MKPNAVLWRCWRTYKPNNKINPNAYFYRTCFISLDIRLQMHSKHRIPWIDIFKVNSWVFNTCNLKMKRISVIFTTGSYAHVNNLWVVATSISGGRLRGVKVSHWPFTVHQFVYIAWKERIHSLRKVFRSCVSVLHLLEQREHRVSGEYKMDAVHDWCTHGQKVLLNIQCHTA